MARALRVDAPGAWHHVTSRGNERKRIFRGEDDCRHFCELLQEMVAQFRVRLHCYVLMGNHYHLLLQCPEANLSAAIQWLNLSYTLWFNKKHCRSGHLVQGRFKSFIVEPRTWGLGLSRYVHLNPVRTKKLGMGKTDRRRQRRGVDPAPDAAWTAERLKCLREFPWNSYRYYVGLSVAPDWLDVEPVLELTGARGVRHQQRAYREYVESALRQGLGDKPWENLAGGVILGSDEFVRAIRRKMKGNVKEQPSLRALRARPTWQQIVRAVEKIKNERWKDFRDRYGDWGRDLAMYLGRRLGGMKLAQLGEAVGGLDYRSASWVVKRFARKMEDHPTLKTKARAAMNEIQNQEM